MLTVENTCSLPSSESFQEFQGLLLCKDGSRPMRSERVSLAAG